MRSIASLAGVAMAAAASAQFGPHQFLQFRDLSGLSGGGFGVTYDGHPSIAGAMAFSTPIGFALKGDRFDLGFAAASRDNLPQFINLRQNAAFHSDGTAALIVGIGTPVGNLDLSYEVVSSALDQVYNAQWQLPLNAKKFGVSLGVQNLTNRPESAKNSRSWYGVGTLEVAHGDFVSIGLGDVRFHGVFANASALITPKLKGLIEYDSFKVNTGIAYSFGRVKDLGSEYFSENEVTMFAGFMNLHRATIGVSFAF